jgi:hypothetical protein
VEVIGIWYIQLETKLLESYELSLNICKELALKANIMQRQCSKTMVVSDLSTMMVRSEHPVA